MAGDLERLFLCELTADIDEKAIAAYCESWGELAECQLMCDRISGHSRGFAFLRFRHALSAQQFLSSAPHYICDCRVAVKVASATKQSISNFDASPLLRSTKRIFVSYFGEKQIEKLTFHEHFSSYGIVSELLLYSSQLSSLKNNRIAGFAIVHFVDVESVEKCFAYEGKHCIDGQIMQLRRIISTEGVVKRKRELFVEEVTLQNQIRDNEVVNYQQQINYFNPINEPVSVKRQVFESNVTSSSLLVPSVKLKEDKSSSNVSPPPEPKKPLPKTFKSFQIRRPK